MNRSNSSWGISVWSRLRTRMAASYVVVTLVIVLLLETLALALVFYLVTRSPMAGYWALQKAGQAAQVYALQAAVRADGTRLNASASFEPEQAGSLALRRTHDPPNLSWFELEVPYITPGSTPPARPTFALIIDQNEQVVASSYPDRYPASRAAAEIVPQEITLIRGALAGKNDGDVRNTAQGMQAKAAYTIWSRDQEPIGAVYVQSPAGAPPNANLLADVIPIVVPSGVVWLCLMLPIGLIFGVLTTRGQIRRIERLASATAGFRDGDTSIRVPVRQADEIGQLEQQFNQMAEQLVKSFDQRQALAEESARREERARIEQEMRLAHYIQQSLLPGRSPDIPGWQIQASYRPALDVGGDFYDFLTLPDGRIGIVIGDATGKGVPSALIMATTCAMIRAAAPGMASPGKVLALVNNLLQANIPGGTFATCFYAILDPARGRMRYANAGHNLPYLARNGETCELRAVGMPLGLMPEEEYNEEEVHLSAEDCILFYTDGLVESHNSLREMFGAARLRQRIQERARADGLIDALYEDFQAFTGQECEQEDDITLIVLRKI